MIRQDGMSVNLEGMDLKEVDCFRYLGVDVVADGTMGVEVNHWVEEGAKSLMH